MTKAAVKAPAPTRMVQTGSTATKAREVLYPKVKVEVCANPDSPGCEDAIGPITAAQAKQLLGWETEADFVARKLKENPNAKQSKLMFKNDFLLVDSQDRKVRCWHNAKNRPFDEQHARKLSQDILYRNWMLNLENIIVSKYGTVTSGQHRLIALVLAVDDYYAHEAHWKEYWAEEPWIESTIAFGGEEDDRTLRTLDNVKPRTLSDVFYTLPMFAKLQPAQRRLCSRMMDNAVDLLWKRTRAKNDWQKFQTHSASLDFSERHPRLLTCVNEIFNRNKDNQLSNLSLYPGNCAALLYLMGSSSSDHEDYHHYEGHSEQVMSWDMWDKALQFWQELSDKTDRMEPIQDKLGAMASEEGGKSGTPRERHAVIAKAWDFYIKDEEFGVEELELEYQQHPTNLTMHLINEPLIGGIDCGTGTPEISDKQKAEFQANIDAAHAARAADLTGASRVRDAEAKLAAVKPAVSSPVTVTADATKKVLPNNKKPAAKAPAAKPAAVPVSVKDLNPVTNPNGVSKKPAAKTPTGKRPTGKIITPPHATGILSDDPNSPF